MPCLNKNTLSLLTKKYCNNFENCTLSICITFCLWFKHLLQPSSHQHATLIIEEFEPDVFRQLIEYIHTGCVTLQPRTLLG